MYIRHLQPYLVNVSSKVGDKFCFGSESQFQTLTMKCLIDCFELQHCMQKNALICGYLLE